MQKDKNSRIRRLSLYIMLVHYHHVQGLDISLWLNISNSCFGSMELPSLEYIHTSTCRWKSLDTNAD